MSVSAWPLLSVRWLHFRDDFELHLRPSGWLLWSRCKLEICVQEDRAKLTHWSSSVRELGEKHVVVFTFPSIRQQTFSLSLSVCSFSPASSPSLLYLLSLRLSITSFLPLLALLLRLYTPSHLSPLSLYLSHHHPPPPLSLSLWIIHQCFSELLSACLPTVISTGTLSGTIPTSAGN